MLTDLILYGFPWTAGEKDGRPIEKFKVEVGSAYGMASDPRFRLVDMTGGMGGYDDHAAVLSQAEVLDLAKAGGAAQESLDQLKVQLDRYRFVVAHIFEWETGLDC